MDQQQSGGWSPVEPATPEVQQICDKVKPQVEVLVPGADVNVFSAVSFAYQIVAGMNYVIKVDVDGNVCVHVMVSAALPCFGEELKVLRIQYPKDPSDPLQPF
ncbi:cystatin-A5-like [Myxocyprinus asiaticus]|uniref:cystatin-A5-like n=1 Tax=Myxocyprinus asiaticus TaxID=70543 RepID=UPI0022224A7A|nr:cystatin-A5-like [Myxocyprinus asiaticus]